MKECPDCGLLQQRREGQEDPVERCQKPSGTFIKIIKTFRQSLRNPFAAACFAFADLLHPKTSFANPFAEFLLLAPKLIK